MVKTRELDNIMEIDHVVRVWPNGAVTSAEHGVYAPEVFVFCDVDGQVSREEETAMVERAKFEGWDLMRGYTGQYLMGDSTFMHSSEYIGGRMEADIREAPGLYVACVIECLGPNPDANENETPAGWVVARKLDQA